MLTSHGLDLKNIGEMALAVGEDGASLTLSFYQSHPAKLLLNP